jgi:hypothetical protein
VQIVAASGKEMGKTAVEQMMHCGGAGCDQGKRVGSYLRGSVGVLFFSRVSSTLVYGPGLHGCEIPRKFCRPGSILRAKAGFNF